MTTLEGLDELVRKRSSLRKFSIFCRFEVEILPYRLCYLIGGKLCSILVVTQIKLEYKVRRHIGGTM